MHLSLSEGRQEGGIKIKHKWHTVYSAQWNWNLDPQLKFDASTIKK